MYSTCIESLSEGAQKTIVKCGATSSTANRVIRLFHGENYSKSGGLVLRLRAAELCGVERIEEPLMTDISAST